MIKITQDFGVFSYRITCKCMSSFQLTGTIIRIQNYGLSKV